MLPVGATIVVPCAPAVVMPVEVADLGDQLDSHVPQCCLNLLAWSNTPQQPGRDIGTQIRRRAGRDQPNQQHMKPVDGLGTVFDQVIAILDHRAQRTDRLIDSLAPTVSSPAHRGPVWPPWLESSRAYRHLGWRPEFMCWCLRRSVTLRPA
ncbi:hypothetical protein [Jatrophihabitans lederbergiae]|uniref:Uncharacterized protein n=1 Tax=Jatrophihabitans lederbergiae TaxID=3075547 RepID=A0ABU2JGT4_9ACTN|nr:hypothetical protein [Jatrophihabitans sp. DSM 44399]MDT0264211.1 hypothetical protein [Jatrophihabitans sp. DSM 44399]